mmetsp:Transcript_2583/g.8826  ORF Transcript_2583/g.8826 Transcript_2583/m.8826 type:complete len:223 (+) Transcript_2583:191-859(+)
MGGRTSVVRQGSDEEQPPPLRPRKKCSPSVPEVPDLHPSVGAPRDAKAVGAASLHAQDGGVVAVEAADRVLGRRVVQVASLVIARGDQEGAVRREGEPPNWLGVPSKGQNVLLGLHVVQRDVAVAVAHCALGPRGVEGAAEGEGGSGHGGGLRCGLGPDVADFPLESVVEHPALVKAEPAHTPRRHAQDLPRGVRVVRHLPGLRRRQLDRRDLLHLLRLDPN